MAPTNIAPDADWLDRLRLAAGRDPERGEQIHITRGRIDGLKWQIVSAGASASGKRLLVIELPEGTEERMLEMLRAVAAGE